MVYALWEDEEEWERRERDRRGGKEWEEGGICEGVGGGKV